MFYDPVAGEVIDFVGGRADLDRASCAPSATPTSRFSEDRLRMLRAVRFATLLGFEIHPATWDALRKQAPEIHAVSAERIREELVRIFLSPIASAASTCWTIAACWPGSSRRCCRSRAASSLRNSTPKAMSGFTPAGCWNCSPSKSPFRSSSPCYCTISASRPPSPSIPPRAASGSTRHDKVGAGMTAPSWSGSAFPRDEIDATVEAVDQHMVFKDVQRMRVARLKRFMARPGISRTRWNCTASIARAATRCSTTTSFSGKQEEFASEPLIPPPLVNGGDLIALGWKPGPKFKEVLDAVQTRQLEGVLTTREEALAWLKTEYPEGYLK